MDRSAGTRDQRQACAVVVFEERSGGPTAKAGVWGRPALSDFSNGDVRSLWGTWATGEMAGRLLCCNRHDMRRAHRPNGCAPIRRQGDCLFAIGMTPCADLSDFAAVVLGILLGLVIRIGRCLAKGGDPPSDQAFFVRSLVMVFRKRFTDPLLIEGHEIHFDTSMR